MKSTDGVVGGPFVTTYLRHCIVRDFCVEERGLREVQTFFLEIVFKNSK